MTPVRTLARACATPLVAAFPIPDVEAYDKPFHFACVGALAFAVSL